MAWKIVKGTEKGSWKPLWLELFKSLKEVIPNDWQVIVSADTGLYADWLFREPARAERIWLAMAVATLWTIAMGSEQQKN